MQAEVTQVGLSVKKKWDRMSLRSERGRCALVSTRRLAIELGVDREGFQKRIRDERWKHAEFLTLDQMERQIKAHEAAGNHDLAETFRNTHYHRGREFEICCLLLRAMIREARAAK